MSSQCRTNSATSHHSTARAWRPGQPRPAAAPRPARRPATPASAPLTTGSVGTAKTSTLSPARTSSFHPAGVRCTGLARGTYSASVTGAPSACGRRRPSCPVARRRPPGRSSITSTRSNPSSRSRSWVTTTTCCASSSITRATRRVLTRSSSVVGSSKTIRAGRMTSTPGDGQQLLLPAGEQVRRMVGVPGQPVPLQHLRHALRPLGGGTPWFSSPYATSSATVGCTICASGSWKTKPTRRRTSRTCVRVSRPSTSTRARRRHDQTVEQPGERALARAVGADDADPPLGQAQVEAGEHRRGRRRGARPRAARCRGPGPRPASVGLPPEPHRRAAARCGRSITG